MYSLLELCTVALQPPRVRSLCNSLGGLSAALTYSIVQCLVLTGEMGGQAGAGCEWIMIRLAVVHGLLLYCAAVSAACG